MKTIVIDGVIGWDVTAADIRQAIREAKGEDLEIEINSPGGMVTEGIAIYNAIKNAQGKKTTRITGMAASMGSYIALAADRVTAEANAIYMVHNAMGVAVGNQHDMRKTADVIEGMSKLLAQAYVKKTGKTDKEIATMMDGETFLFGAEIMDAGFADEIIGQPDTEKAQAVITAKAIVASATDLLKDVTNSQDTEQAAACLAEHLPIKKTVAVGSVAAGPKKTQEVNEMTEQEIQALKATAYQEGIEAERTRVAGLAQWRTINAETAKIADEAIASGKDFNGVHAQLAAAAARTVSARADGENPPAVTSSVATTASGANGLDEVDIEAAKAFGMTHAEYLKFKDKE
jgi:ATP-dependent Clp endopeptidase proteolytic subunit ClpP